MHMEGVAEVFVINLRRRPDRLQGFRTRCPYSDLSVMEGVDGFDLSTYSLSREAHPTTNQLYLRHQALVKASPEARRLRYGEFGCMASHLKIYATMVERDIPHAAIFEDDAFFTADFSSKVWLNLLRAMGSSAPAGPTGFLYLGGRFDDQSRLPSYCDSGLGDALVYHDFHKGSWDWWQEDRTTHAYVVTVAMAKRLLNYFLEGDGSLLPLDHALLHFFKLNTITPLNAQPLVCYSPKEYDTDIQGRADHIPVL